MRYNVTNLSREQLLGSLLAFAEEKPGFSSGNYLGAIAGLRRDRRRAQEQLNDVREIFRVVEGSAITAEDIVRHARRWNGRLRHVDGGWDYIPGQYRPTEYRMGVASFLASLLWDLWVGQRIDGLGPNPTERAKQTFSPRIAHTYFL